MSLMHINRAHKIDSGIYLDANTYNCAYVFELIFLSLSELVALSELRNL